MNKCLSLFVELSTENLLIVLKHEPLMICFDLCLDLLKHTRYLWKFHQSDYCKHWLFLFAPRWILVLHAVKMTSHLWRVEFPQKWNGYTSLQPQQSAASNRSLWWWPNRCSCFFLSESGETGNGIQCQIWLMTASWMRLWGHHFVPVAATVDSTQTRCAPNELLPSCALSL